MVDKKKTWRRFAGRVGLAIAAPAIVGMIVVAWMPKPVPVEVAAVSRGALVVTVQEDGRTRVKDRHVVSAPLMGNLARPEIHAGDSVEVGQVLARLVPVPAPLLDPRSRSTAVARVAASQAALRQAEASVARATTTHAFAERELERQRALTGQGAVARESLERAELELKSRAEELTSARFGARVGTYEVEMAKAALGILGSQGASSGDQLEVRAPVTGRVLKVFAESEGVVMPGAPLLEVGDTSALEVVVDVLTADAVRIQAGAKAVIERWGGEGSLEGRVRVVEPSAFSRLSALGVEEQRVNAVIELTEAKERWSRLGDGFRVEARIVVEEHPDVLLVPTSAVFHLGERWVVYRVVDGHAQIVTLTLGARNDRTWEVKSGLEAGDRVVVYPSASMSDGAKVAIR